EVKGPSVISGYWSSFPDGGSGLLRGDGFLRTGDLGYLAGGELFVTGRIKDVIIIAGRNINPFQVEALVEPIVDSGIVCGVAACGVPDARSGTEALHLLIESEVLPRPDAAAIEERTRNAVAEAFGVTGIVIHWLAKGRIAKTTSGKIQHYRCKEWVISTLANRDRTDRS
ncbi:MAG TPA: hypothetical protein VF469_07375, partial [Kofleriaceae bacterium]